MMTIERRVFCQMLLALSAGTALVGPAFAQDKIAIVFANDNDEDPFASTVAKGVRDAAAQRPDLDVKLLNNGNDPQKAVENARAVVSMNPAVFIEYNVHAASNKQVGRILKEAGIPVLSIQVPVEGTPLYAVDNTLAGTESGSKLAEAATKRWSGEKPRILIIGAPEMGPVLIERAGAAKAALQEAFPDAPVDEFSSRMDVMTARQVMTDYLTRFPDDKILVWVHVDPIAVSALAAVRNAKREGDVLMSSTGGNSAVFPEIRSGDSPLIGTFSFFPENWGQDILDLGRKIANGEPVPERIKPTQQIFIDASNIDTHYAGK